MIWNKRNLIQISALDRFFVSVRFYSDAGNLRYWQNWIPKLRKLGGRRFSIDVLWLGFVFEDYEQ
jgi:hypothetical protein